MPIRVPLRHKTHTVFINSGHAFLSNLGHSLIMGWGSRKCECFDCRGLVHQTNCTACRHERDNPGGVLYNVPVRYESEGDQPEQQVDYGDYGPEVGEHKATAQETMQAFSKEMLAGVADGYMSQQGCELACKIFRDKFTDHLAQAPYRDIGDKALTIPASMHMLRKRAGIGKSTTQMLDICPWGEDCHVFASDDSDTVCPVCAGDRHSTGTVSRQLLVTNYTDRLVRMFAVPALAEAMQYPLVRVPGDGDCWDANVLRDTSMETRANTLFFMATTDGAVFKTGKKQTFTPCTGQLLNLPPRLRTSFAGMFLFGMMPEKVLLFTPRI